jgi:hypothetical protein
MREPWQPYPNHPQIRELIELLTDLQQRAVQAALATGDFACVQQLLDERQAARARLEEVTATLLRDESLTPRWVAHTEADAAGGAVPCLGCGNNVPAGQPRCAYCGWTYLVECSPRA